MMDRGSSLGTSIQYQDKEIAQNEDFPGKTSKKFLEILYKVEKKKADPPVESSITRHKKVLNLQF